MAQGQDIVEYRMEGNGNRLDHPGLNKGYFATLGFALSCNYFSTAFQPQDTHVVAFAQQPGKAALFVTMT